MKDCATNKSLISDANIILQFLSITGIPNISNFKAKKVCNNFKILLLYLLAIYFFCISLLLSAHRFDTLQDKGNFLSSVNGMATGVSSILLKFFLIVKVKKLNIIFNSFYEFMTRIGLKFNSSWKIILIGCIVSLLLPIFFSSYHLHILHNERFYEWIRISQFLSKFSSLERVCVSILDLGYAIVEYTFPFISTILLTFIYTSFNRSVLKPFVELLKATYNNPTSESIKVNLDTYAEVRRIWIQIEDFASVNAFFLFGFSFFSAMYLVGKYVSIEQAGLTTLSKFRAVFCIAQIIMLSAAGSETVNKWKEIRLLVQEMFRFYSKLIDKQQNKDIFPLLALLEGTKMDLCFSCFGILTLDWSLLLKTAMTTVTFGALML